MRLPDVLNDARSYINYWVLSKEVIGNEQSTLRLDYSRDVKAYNVKLSLDFEDAKKKNLVSSKDKPKYIKKLDNKALDDAFDEYLRKLPFIKREEVASLVKCQQENLEPIEQWVTAVSGQCLELDLAVMCHWLWLVKRNLAGLPVVYHIMPIIASPQQFGVRKQGGGKSTAISKLISPVKPVSTTLRMDKVSDERGFTTFNTYLIGFLDEMAGADKVEIEEFKRIVTAEVLMYRPMRTNAQVQVKNLCSFIGASNNALNDIVKDTTGLRRFFPISALETLNHELINSIDYLALWKGIDETRERGYFESVISQVSEIQERAAVKDELELFIDDFNLVPNGPIVHINVKVLFDAYVLQSKNFGNKYTLKYQNFYKRLEALGLRVTEKRDDKRARYRVVEVNAEHALGGSNVVSIL